MHNFCRVTLDSSALLDFKSSSWVAETIIRVQVCLFFTCYSNVSYIFPALAYARVYLNRQTAAAHHFIFKKIEEIILHDTGKSLQWRHLHAQSVHEYVGILHWAADQHGGQAKGANSNI